MTNITLHYFFVLHLALLPDNQIFKVMENQRQEIDNLMNAIFDYMRDIHRCEGTISRYRRRWQHVKCFMLQNQIKYYDAEVEQAYLTSTLGNYDYSKLNRKEKDLINIIEVLSEFQKTGRLLMGPRKHHPKVFTGFLGQIIIDFLQHRENSFRLSKKTIQSYIIYLYPLYCHINSLRKHITDITASDILSYIEMMDPCLSAKKHVALILFRIFFRYLYEQHILLVNYSQIIPKDNYKNQPKLPSSFTDEEITTLLKAVDRGSPKGKRDYAILLLAIKLGLRASDICELKFEHIIWDRNIITFNQYKTGKDTELPLLPEIGNAIINYLKHGRPVSKDSHCFLHLQSPYERIHTHDIGNLVHRHMTLAGINYSNRKHGSHSLRHSFASALLRENVPLPIISEALGHRKLESSMYYLRIDLNSLRKCALDVPPVPSSFYEQKGGCYYE
jgi:site-specific recombinase XerD